MKRIFYVSRCTRALTREDLDAIGEAAERNNQRDEITGFLIQLGEFFFQALEGPDASVDRLFRDKIQQDPRHTEICLLRSENQVKRRQFPQWRMRVFDLDSDQTEFPTAFRRLMEALTESNLALARYTQPTVLRLLQQGINPTSLRPRKRRVSVLFSDIIGFSILAEGLPPSQLLRLVNTQVGICAEAVQRQGGEINKLLGDGVLAYFRGSGSDGAIQAGLDILKGMRELRAEARAGSPEQWLFSGVGLAYGSAYEGNIGVESKQDFTILGNTVNLASRLESMTRPLGVRIVASRSVVEAARKKWPFVALGGHDLKGLGNVGSLYSMDGIEPLNVRRVYAEIRKAIAAKRR